VGPVPLPLHRSGFSDAQVKCRKGFQGFQDQHQKSKFDDRRLFLFFGNACSSDDGSDGRGPAEGSTCLRNICFSAASGRRRLCALMASETVLSIMTGLSGKLSRVGTIGVSLGQLQRCMRNGEAATSWRLAR
jgi:hypothetical protein